MQNYFFVFEICKSFTKISQNRLKALIPVIIDPDYVLYLQKNQF